MSAISALFPDASLPYWTLLGHALDFLVALGVIGESYSHLIPNRFLPISFRSDERKKVAGKWSTILLCISILAVVPVGMIKDLIGDRIVEELGKASAARSLGLDQQKRIAEALRGFPDQQFSGMVASGVPDAWGLWNAILNALQEATWKRVSPSGLEIAGVGIPIVADEGVMIFIPETDWSALFPAAGALRNALMHEHIVAAVAPMTGQQARPKIIVIEVGMKPQSE